MPKRIDAIHDALMQGIPKGEIQQRFDVSEWTIILIELDRPELGDAHRKATAILRLEKHRNALLSFVRDNPSESRHKFVAHHVGAYEWLKKYDRDWLETHLPKPDYSNRYRNRKARKNWHQLDQAAVLAVRRDAHQEFAKFDRPIRLTKTRLLSVAGALAALNPAKRYRYPTAAAEAERLSETKEQFIRRKLRWALQKYAGLHMGISMSQLRRVSGLTASRLLEYRDYIIEVATEMELPFDARCALAPWRDHDDANDNSTLTAQ